MVTCNTWYIVTYLFVENSGWIEAGNGKKYMISLALNTTSYTKLIWSLIGIAIRVDHFISIVIQVDRLIRIVIKVDRLIGIVI